ncbi:hypothetical protein K469DRAFT_648642 [Zopfia rhizophila CBS 207.26]|uniref:Transposase IS30-like HTH domain-containing protein n=1 Tax=Zopfia rhizophila CBS 207.26 TaxID=1314779 RepID=A0A6A6EYU3_9PEZI|nr:hypothetical protein K469DRAFT_648642 [Zopfia rhizophila CBS 207.26]
MPGKHKNRKSYRDPNRPYGQRLTERERIQILTLYQVAGWSRRRIAKDLKLGEKTVRDCVNSGIWTPKQQVGRKLILTTQKR